MGVLPNYLIKMLTRLGITSVEDLQKHNYIKVFQYLRYTQPSLSYKTLFDIYSLVNNLPLNSLTSDLEQQLVREYKNWPPTYPPLPDNKISYFLMQADCQAQGALNNDEIPIGAVVVKDDQIIGAGYNQTICQNNITAHAEIKAISAAQEYLNNYRLDDCDLYVTIEPCLMCSGAIINSRIRRLIFGAIEPKTGAIISQYKVFDNLLVNHHTEVIGPVDNAKYAGLLQQFLRNKR